MFCTLESYLAGCQCDKCVAGREQIKREGSKFVMNGIPIPRMIVPKAAKPIKRPYQTTTTRAL
jgi:hypothetical protein